MKKQKYNMKHLLGNNFCKSVALLAIVLLTALPAVSKAQVTIDGNVFGGGRMANVDENAVVHVIGQSGKTEINGVYGGNDVAGSVLGAGGSTIVIGSNEGSDNDNEYEIEIKEVYGGGNGYYTYPGRTIKTGLVAGQESFTTGDIMSFDGVKTVEASAPAGSVPAIKKTSITVNGSNVTIDSLFGGAKNAFINGSAAPAANDIYININNGTIYAAFGGNNYGGTINAGSGIDIDIANTKTDVTYTGIGETHGIAYLYGGGNRVVAPKVDINITGGMIDTCFTGGNSATIQTAAVCTVAVADTKVIYPETPAYDGNGVYNVHTLFGGNNAAAMDILPTLNLTSGGIGTVYGGGNAGDMKAANTAKHTDYTIGTDVNIASANIKIDLVYGGCQKANVDNSTYVSMSNGNVGTIYGGCNISGTIDATAQRDNDANVFISGGTVHKNVFGGSNGYYGCRGNDYTYTDNRFNTAVNYIGTLFPLVNSTQVNITGGTFEGNIYGGGNLAPVGIDVAGIGSTSYGANSGVVKLSISGSGSKAVLINGNVFGGGRMASVFGQSSVEMNATAAYSAGASGVNVKGDIYGGNDIAGTIQSTHTYTASDGSTPIVAASVRLNGKLKLDGSVYGGGNGNYTYYDNATQFGTATETNKVLVCDVDNRPEVTGGAIVDVNTDADGRVRMVYGGGNSATVGTHAIVLLNNSDLTTAENTYNVDTIFGGNNSVDMAIMPTLTLTKGNVNTVYGGGNKGGITCTNGTAHSPSAAEGVNLTGLSTYVLLNSATVHAESIYGGCRIAPVSATTYVDLHAGEAHEVYGGNDVAGNVTSSVVNLNGTATVENIYGGGNGYYYYHEGNAYEFGDHSKLVATGASSAPNVGETHVNLISGTVEKAENTDNGYVYGGGKAGDATSTNVTVEAGAVVQGTIFGGGCGDFAHIGYCDPHVGNTGTANVVVNGMYADIPRIFAGGRAGDVENTYITVNDAATQYKIGALYGGCMASNLTGTTNVTIGNTVSTPASNTTNVITIDTIYGGNDFAGLTQNTKITINNGKFVHLYGAGNGDYDYETIMQTKLGTAYSTTTCLDTIPYSMNVDVTINGGYFDNKVYGGGNMGLVGSKNISASNYPEGTQNADLYGYIYMTVHGGYFNNHIFAGAAGKLNYKKQYFGFEDEDNPRYGAGDKSKPDTIPGFTPDDRVSLLVYGYKQFNMDGGTVRFSVYGGSESVDDGYPYECWDNTYTTNSTTGKKEYTKTSQRPSSVINIMGGTVQNRIYGAGYKGNVFGSVYVNVGEYAIHDSPVWSNLYQRNGTTLGVTFADQHNNHTNIVRRNPILLLNSIYNGSDWGEAGASQYFTTRGFYGGEGLIYIDGEGYSTSTTASSDPVMELSASLLGSGTSTAPADVNSRITVKNYGDFYNCPSPSRSLKSIQRTNRVWLENVYLDLEGDNDAYSSYTSVHYAMNRIDTLIFHHQNLIETVAPSINIGMMMSEDADTVPYTYTDLTGTEGAIKTDCDNTTSICSLIDAPVLDKNILLLDNASYISVSKSIEPDDDHPDGQTIYGPVIGYAYLLASNNTKAYVYAQKAPIDQNTEETNYKYSGFVGPCESANENSEPFGQQILFTNSTVETNSYRSWGVGTNQGERKRQLTLVAHINPDKVRDDHYFTGPAIADVAESTKWAYVSGKVTLPPSADGHFYTISSVIIDEDNGGQLMLTEYAFNPADSTNETTHGWYSPYGSPSSTLSQSQEQIASNSANTFALSFSLGEFFDKSATSIDIPEGSDASAYRSVTMKDMTIISGKSNHSATVESFLSKPIDGNADGVLPTLDLALTYYTDFATTFTRDVIFIMDEYDANGAFVGPVEVTVTISTVISDFDNLKAPLLAMYNAGRKNTYTRRVTIPASFVQRDLYLTGIEWAPTNAADNYPTSISTTTYGRFQLDALTSSYTPSDYKHFAISINPTQRISGNASSTLGWYDIEPGAQNMDAHSLGGSPESEKWHSVTNIEDNTKPYFRDLTIGTAGGNGKHIGILDGRSAAAFDISLNYNGNLIYEKVPDLANLRLYFKYADTKTSTETGTFYIDVKVQTRQNGDTIYMAEPGQYYLYAGDEIDTTKVGHSGEPLSYIHRYGKRGDIPVEGTEGDYTNYTKNDPYYYLSTFESALAIYKEGDVICILDTIHVDDATKPISIQGVEIDEIRIIRYSGSHFRWPGEVCSYRGPMIKISDGGKFIASYVYFDGSGCSKTSKGVENKTTPTRISKSDGTSKYNESQYLSPVEGDYLIMDSTKYTYPLTQRDTLFANAPIFWVEDGSTLKFNAGVTVTNNYNNRKGDGESDTSYLGGAIGMYATAAGAPTVQMGTDIKIEGNLIVDYHTSCMDDPYNYGGAIYNNGGKVELGVSGSDHTINVNNNYYIPQAALSTNFDVKPEERTGTAGIYFYKDSTEVFVASSSSFYRKYYVCDTSYEGYHNSNIYLTRVKPTTVSLDEHNQPNAHEFVTKDAQSDMIYVKNELTADSKIGVSKWFPGFITTSQTYGRDTIAIVNYSQAGIVAAQNNYNQHIFVDDSLNYRDYDCIGGVEDDVDIRWSSLMNPYNIYLHRCATFHYDFARPLAYIRDVDVFCPGDGDTIQFNVVGGASLYTYNLYKYNDNDRNSGETIIASIVDNEKTANFVPLNLNLAPNTTEATYFLKAEAIESGGCKTEYPIEMRVNLVAPGTTINGGINDPEHTTTLNYWLQKPTDTAYSAPSATAINYSETEGASDYHTEGRIFRVYSNIDVAWEVSPVGYGSITAQSDGVNVVTHSKFCPGDVINLKAIPAEGKEFVMWDNDPFTFDTLNYVVGKEDATLHAYMSDTAYWYHHVRTKPTGYVVDYYGNVTISTKEGLAWLISTVNGLNNQQAESFIWDTITIASGTYDMSGYKWTPVGNLRNPFRGVIKMKDDATITNIIVNEKMLPDVGFFGVTDSARIKKMNIGSATIHGTTYGGALIGNAGPNTIVDTATISNASVSSAEAVGGLIGRAQGDAQGNVWVKDVIIRNTVNLIGSAVYAGGVVGYASNTGVSNSLSIETNMKTLEPLYAGAIAGMSEGRGTPLNAKSAGRSQIMNNYANVTGCPRAFYAGGLVGYATETDLQNNYVYGDVSGISAAGGLIGLVGDNVSIDRCYYGQDMGTDAFGKGDANASNVATFNGSGNHVTVSDTIEGASNLTQLLNIWVREHGDSYNAWRSDFDTINSGYPVFGTPDMIPVYGDTVNAVVCDTFAFSPEHKFTESGVYSIVLTDSLMFVDSIITIDVIVNHSVNTEYSDSVEWGSDYSGYDFNLSSAEIAMYREGQYVRYPHYYTTAEGCDSTINLNLFILNGPLGIDGQPVQFSVSIYPNPTSGVVNIKADGLKQVELYDATSRKVLSQRVDSQESAAALQLNLSQIAAGSYYIRIHTDHGDAVQKIIKR